MKRNAVPLALYRECARSIPTKSNQRENFNEPPGDQRPRVIIETRSKVKFIRFYSSAKYAASRHNIGREEGREGKRGEMRRSMAIIMENDRDRSGT